MSFKTDLRALLTKTVLNQIDKHGDLDFEADVEQDLERAFLIAYEAPEVETQARLEQIFVSFYAQGLLRGYPDFYRGNTKATERAKEAWVHFTSWQIERLPAPLARVAMTRLAYQDGLQTGAWYKWNAEKFKDEGSHETA